MPNDTLDRCANCELKQYFDNPISGFTADNCQAECYVIPECPQKEWDLFVTKATKEPENL